MGVPTHKKRLAFDTNVLIDLAYEVDSALTLKEILTEKKVDVAIPPTVVQELVLLFEGPDKAKSKAALKALQRVREWGFTPYDLKSVGHGITEIFSKSLITKGLLPEGEMNDGCILAEVSLGGINMLVTSDNHLLSIDQTDLNAEFIAKDLSIVNVMSPTRILRTMAPNDKRPGKY